jgi:exosortase
VTNGNESMPLKTRTLLFAFFVSITCAAQPDVIRRLFAISQADATASHLILVPLVSCALVFNRRREIFSAVAPSWQAGSALIAGGAAVGVLIRLFHPIASEPIEFSVLVAALLVVWLGGFLALFGAKALWSARFAAGFLLFTIPIPELLIHGATEVLKRGSTEAVAALFTLTGTPYHREGFVFSLPHLSIEVADACSGIRSSIALLLTGMLAAHTFLKTGWKKVLLVACVLPVAIFKNGVRIVSLSLLASHVDPGFLVGRLHHDGGVVFFLMALGLLLPVLAVLRRSDASGSFEDQRPAPQIKAIS